MTSGEDQFEVPSEKQREPGVLAQTDRWLALAKPSGWLTIPGRAAPGQRAGEAFPVVSEWAAREHGPVWVVHRLDRETSGVLLLARSENAHREANTWFQQHRVRKAYDFLAMGSLSQPMIRVAAPIAGQASVTQIEEKEVFLSCFLGRAVPLTGRRHQIRIHLAALGHPLWGDPRYGGPVSVSRVALHAARLELPTGEVFEASWPDDFAGWIRKLRETQGE
ncbi:RNA pseudouridine synthase [Bdellovibrionota bacterium FG-1]